MLSYINLWFIYNQSYEMPANSWDVFVCLVLHCPVFFFGQCFVASPDVIVSRLKIRLVDMTGTDPKVIQVHRQHMRNTRKNQDDNLFIDSFIEWTPPPSSMKNGMHPIYISSFYFCIELSTVTTTICNRSIEKEGRRRVTEIAFRFRLSHIPHTVRYVWSTQFSFKISPLSQFPVCSQSYSVDFQFHLRFKVEYSM